MTAIGLPQVFSLLKRALEIEFAREAGIMQYCLEKGNPPPWGRTGMGKDVAEGG